MEQSDLEKLLAQCKSNDVDVKIDAVTKLQRAFESGVAITDADSLIATLKTCLRTSNQHLSAATLSALPPLFPLLNAASSDTHPDPATLRQALTAFLPAGGLVDKLGDSRERARENARDSLVALGSLAFRCGSASTLASTRQKDVGKGPESPLMVWERFVKEGGLQSKVWRVREQAILTLVHVRRLHPTFPLRPYLPLLVDSLEDTDGTVRECARVSVGELFTGPSVTDAARTDLKREMTKKGVRKTIVDSVLQQLMGRSPTPSQFASIHSRPPSSNGGSDNGDVPTKKEYIPPSLKLQGKRPASSAAVSRTLSQSTTSTSVAESTSRPPSRFGPDTPITPTADTSEVPAVYIASAKDLEDEFARMLKPFEGKETEHNWADRERAVNQIRGMLKGDAHIRYPDVFLSCFKSVLDGTYKALISLRTTVCTNTCSLYGELAIALGPTFDPFVEPILTHLLRMSSITKKITANSSQSTVSIILNHTSPQPRVVLSLLSNTLQDRNVSSRQYAVDHIKTYLEVHGQRAKHSIESSGAIETLDKSIRTALRDQNPSVRERARSTFWTFEGIWKERASAIIGSLDATAQKQLERACPTPGKKVVAPSTPQAKKSSVAAAIAASRAKAKAIATAPPSLRHQATSTSQILHQSTTAAHRPLSPARSATGISSLRRSSGLSRPISPASPTRRIASFSPPSSIVASLSSPVHSRSLSTESSLSTVSLSSLPHRRVASQQMSPTSSKGSSSHAPQNVALPPSPPESLDLAMKTSLPPSPPRIFHTRIPSPTRATRIPSPTHRVGVRKSLIGTIAQAQFDDPFDMPHGMVPNNDESLLLAQTIPLPEDSDLDDDSRMLSFSAPYEYEKYHHTSIPKTATSSSLSAGSPPPSSQEAIVEDALRARAEQAESAAERLLELVEPEDETHVSPIPPSLLPTNGATSKASKASSMLMARTNEGLLTTPVAKKSSILRQVSLFKDSPAYKASSLLDVLKERKVESGWSLKRLALIDKGNPFKGADNSSKLAELKKQVATLEAGTTTVDDLKRLAMLCYDSPAHEDLSDGLDIAYSFPQSPTPFSMRFNQLRLNSAMPGIWDEEKIFDRLFKSLLLFLSPEKADDILEYGLIVLWEILDNQAPLVEGREADVFSTLLQVRYCNVFNILEATNTIRDTIIGRIEPVYGLTTLHACLKTFYTKPPPPQSNTDVRSASYSFGLIALGKFMLRLPAGVLEDELLRLKATLTAALSDSSSLVVRESAAACIIAAQTVLKDETHLFTLLDGLTDEKKNLLTYLFDKHGARGSKASPSTEKLEREMRRLDGRTSTPPRSVPAA